MIAIDALVSLLVLAGAPADEVAVNAADVPPAVLAAVDRKYPAAKKLGFAREAKDETATYEVSITARGRKIDIGLSPEGKILIEEHLISLEAVPRKVRKALADSRYGKWRVERSERVVIEENEPAATYELVVARGDKRVQLVFDRDGQLTKEEPKTGKAND